MARTTHYARTEHPPSLASTLWASYREAGAPGTTHDRTKHQAPGTSTRDTWRSTVEMFLMVATVSLLGIVVTVGLFAASMHSEQRSEEARPQMALPLAPPRFFLQGQATPTATKVPIEVLLLQIERHVRLEQAAAESFLDAPTTKSLHTRTTSPLIVH